MKTTELVGYLDSYLRVADVPDYRGALNGLQVEGRPEIQRVLVAVDACKATIDYAADGGYDLLIVHHGLFWGATAPITGTYYRRVTALVTNGVALYSSHLPLDTHEEVGNNYVLARMLNLTPYGRFGHFEGAAIGVTARAGCSRDELVDRIRTALGVDPLVIPAGPQALSTVAILTGGGGSMIAEASAAGVDLFLTGEGPHHSYFDAEERGINVVYAGHYATETVGVQALGVQLAERFGLTVDFFDHPTGL